MDWIKNCPRRMMVGFHVPDYDQIPEFPALKKKTGCADILEHVEPREIVRALKQARIQAFWFYAKCHHGNAYYPSKIGHVHTALRGRDLFGEFCEACLAEGIVPLAVYEFSDLRMAKDHPDWCHIIPPRPAPGKTDVTDAAQGSRVGGPCLNGPYGDFVMEQIREVLSRYPVRGVYMDFLGLFGFENWRCPYCQPKLHRILGRDFAGVANLSHDEYVRYQQWRWTETDVYARRLRQTVKKLRPRAAFVHNFHAFHIPGNMQQFDFASRNCDFLTADFFHLRYGMLQMSWKLRLLAAGSRLKPAETLLDSVVAYQWDFRTPKALDSYNAELWTARSLNVATCTSFIINLDGTFDPQIFALNQRLMREHAACEPWLRNMQPLAVVGLVRSAASLAFRPPETAATFAAAQHHQFAMEGWAQTLVAAHQLWDMVDESRLEPAALQRYRALILPNVSCMSRKAAAALRAYVRAGGILIATGDTSLFDQEGRQLPDFQLADVFGANFAEDRRPQSAELILDDPALIPPEKWISPILRFNDGQLHVRAAGQAVCLGRIGCQANHEMLALQSFPTAAPGLLRHNFGRGACWYFAGKPGLQFRLYGQSNVKLLLQNILRQAVGQAAPVRLDAPDSVELFAHRQAGKKHLVVNLVNTFWGVARSAGGFIRPDGKVVQARFDEIDAMPRLHSLTLRFPAAGRRRPPRVTLAPSGRALRVRRVEDEFHARLTNVGVHAMLIVE